MHDCEQRYGSSYGRRSRGRRRLQSLKLAAARAVEHLPTTGAQPLANLISGREIALAPPLDALGEQALGLLSVR
ncbi:MAG: hypothetical protein E6J05_02550 [Chloroflexi bacterium]|nr:MAG: hypothetical protein E6J05_02550 [Chloroflexota bacterium]